MFSEIKWLALVFCGFLVWSAVLGCDGKQSGQELPLNGKSTKWDRESAESEYRLIQTELRLVSSEKLYLVIDPGRNQLQLRLKGAVVWNYPLQIAQPDSQELLEFVARFMGDDGRFMLPLGDKHLFAGKEKTSDSVLAIVGEVVRVNPDLLQRVVPARFQLLWDYGLTMEIRTQIVGQPKSIVKGALVEFRHALRRPFGEAHLVLKMDPEAALTLYHAVQPGTPTLLYPPK